MFNLWFQDGKGKLYKIKSAYVNWRVSLSFTFCMIFKGNSNMWIVYIPWKLLQILLMQLIFCSILVLVFFETEGQQSQRQNE